MTETEFDHHGDDLLSNVPENLTLAGDFLTPSYQDWLDAVAKVMNRRRPPDKQLTGEQSVQRLTTTTVDGISIPPAYWREDRNLGVPGVEPFTRGASVRNGSMQGWDYCALHEDPDVARTKQAIADDLNRGITSLWLRVDQDAIAVDALADVLADVHLNLAGVSVFSRSDQPAAAQTLLAVAKSQAKPALKLNLGLDPIGVAALHGGDADLSGLPAWRDKLAGFPGSQAIAVDATIYHNAGAGDVHEIAWALATATEYARVLIDAGATPDEAFDQILFRVSATCDQFATIARLRALRPLWNRVGEVFGVSEEHRAARQHAVTSWRELTRDDPYVNILRGTIATFAASVGGADAITVLPFDTVHGLPDELSRRIARNTQVILAEESNIGRVNDPAGGSWYVEKLTDDFTQAAWAQFQRVEAAGGMAGALAKGVVADTLAELNATRTKRIDNRAQPITGVSMFPNFAEPVFQAEPRPEPGPREGLAWRRDSEVFEDMRTATSAIEPQPAVFLACLGARRDFGAREGFASNLFHVGGLATPESEGGSPEEIVAAFQQAGTSVVCLCSSAKIYAEQGLTVAKALKQAGATTVLLAGATKELGDDTAAVDEYIGGTIYAGMDVVQLLQDILQKLGVSK